MHYSPVYEFHDVCVSNFLRIKAELQKYDKEITWNLMVIPFVETKENELYKDFISQLLEWKNNGYGLYLHGYKHKANLNLKRSFFGKLALYFTNNEAEFAGLSKKDSKNLLNEALFAWEKLEVGEPLGFVAPTWHAPKELLNLCKNMGLENYSNRFFIWNKNKGSKLSIPFSTAGLAKILVPLVEASEKIYLKLYKKNKFLPVPRIVKHLY